MKLFYTNARLNHKTALLAGPFLTSAEAEHCIDICGPMFIKEEPIAQAATFGVMSCGAFAGYGRYNDILAAKGINVMKAN